jgi:hypothetical protein
MAAFPAPFAGATALYPLIQEKRFPVAVLQFTDFTEQRYRQSAGLAAFTLECYGIDVSAKEDIVEFFEDSKGSFDATWSITIGATTYNYMAFLEDAITAVELQDGMWAVSAKIVQTRKN